MKPEEAIKFLDGKTMIIPARCNGKTYTINEVRKTAIEALEKQIPKKPLDACEPCVRWGICPVCKGELNMLGGKPNRIFASEKYCKDCGQAIDWGD